MSRVMLIGAGGVAGVAAAKMCQNPETFGELLIASRTEARCKAIKKDIEKRPWYGKGKTRTKITTAQIDAMDTPRLVKMIKGFKPDLVMNIALPYQDLAIMDACLKAGVSYLDTANYEPPEEAHFEYSWQWAYRKRFEKAGLDGALLTEFAKFIRGGRKKKVLFLHLIGSHSAYVNRYPDEFRHFEGEAPGRTLGQAKAQVLNAYDDSVRYTDWLIAELVKELKKIGGAAYLLYFSDHGEDIYDSREDKIMGHGPLANVPMTSVPFMVWTSPRLDALRPDLRGRFAALPEPAAGVESYNLEDAIHTILDLSSLANSDYDSAKSVFGKV